MGPSSSEELLASRDLVESFGMNFDGVASVIVALATLVTAAAGIVRAYRGGSVSGTKNGG